MFRSISLIAAAATLLMFQTATAYADFAAIAWAKSSNAWGVSHGYSSRGGAENRALSECRAHSRGCQIMVWMRNSCGALAVAPGGGYGYSYGATSRGNAQNRAMSECRARNRGCYILAWACSG